MTLPLQQQLHRKGVTKLIEELHELGQVLAKKAAFMNTDDNPDDKGSLKLRLEDEAGDVLAAIAYCVEKLSLSWTNINKVQQRMYSDLTNSIREHDSKGINILLFCSSRICCDLSIIPFGIEEASHKIFDSQLKELENSIGEFLACFDNFAINYLDQFRIDSRKAQKLALFRSWDAPAEAINNA
jgi:NTP pyrophosphatase (non-canonical NTP hydrolase)